MAQNGSPLRVLILEDEALVAMLIEDQLVELGYEVVGPAATTGQAIALCEVEEIDGAILDVNLGGGRRSDAVAQWLHERDIPFVWLTGYGTAGIDGRFSDVAVLQKPFTIRELGKLLENRVGPPEVS